MLLSCGWTLNCKPSADSGWIMVPSSHSLRCCDVSMQFSSRMSSSTHSCASRIFGCVLSPPAKHPSVAGKHSAGGLRACHAPLQSSCTKNHLLQRSRDAWEKWILFARRKSGVFSRDGRWTLFAKAPNVLRGQTRLSSKSRLTLPLGLKTLLRIKLPHTLRKNINIRNLFLLYKLLSVSFLTKKGKNLAWIMLLWNHYILWLLKKFTQYGDFF